MSHEKPPRDSNRLCSGQPCGVRFTRPLCSRRGQAEAYSAQRLRARPVSVSVHCCRHDCAVHPGGVVDCRATSRIGTGTCLSPAPLNGYPGNAAAFRRGLSSRLTSVTGWPRRSATSRTGSQQSSRHPAAAPSAAHLHSAVCVRVPHRPVRSPAQTSCRYSTGWRLCHPR